MIRIVKRSEGLIICKRPVAIITVKEKPKVVKKANKKWARRIKKMLKRHKATARKIKKERGSISAYSLAERLFSERNKVRNLPVARPPESECPSREDGHVWARTINNVKCSRCGVYRSKQHEVEDADSDSQTIIIEKRKAKPAIQIRVSGGDEETTFSIRKRQ